MSFATTSDGVRLFYESAGSGTPIIFVHEFGGSHWSWEPQLNFFARRHRCITFAARGFPPSDIPDSVEAYSQARAADDIMDVLSAAGIDKAHVVGLSMGGFASLHAALRHPNRVLSVVAAGTGYGAEKVHESLPAAGPVSETNHCAVRAGKSGHTLNLEEPELFNRLVSELHRLNSPRQSRAGHAHRLIGAGGSPVRERRSQRPGRCRLAEFGYQIRSCARNCRR
jgi:pimeloyl-ACP methyl ester carboxylesterase